MATYTSGTRNTYYAVLTVTERTPTAAQIAANQTTLDWSLYLYSGYNNFSGYTIGHSVSINGVNVRYQNNSGNQTSMAANSSKYIYSGSINVTHNADGALTVPVSFSIWTDNLSYLPVSLSASGNFTCTTLPRVSDLSLNKTSVPADGTTTVTATATKKNSSFTDTLTVTLGSYSQTITSGTAFTIPKTWINAISGTSAVATVKVTTKSGSTTIGSKTANLTVTVPDSVVPTISAVNVAEAVAAVTTAFGARYVKSLSRLNVTITAAGVYGSTIKSYAAELDGVTYIQQAFTSNVINTAGTLSIVVTVTDSRGRTATKTVTVTIVDYFLPEITSMTYLQCNSDGTANSAGTCTKITIEGKIASVASQNSRKLVLKYKKASATSYTSKTITVSAYTFSVSTIISGTDPTVTYEYVATLTDDINSTSQTIATGVVVISRLAGGGGVTLFKEASEKGFWVGDVDYTITDAEYDELLNLLGGGTETN